MRIAIITGGETGERGVSIKSAANIAKSIDFGETKTYVFPEQKEQFLTDWQEFDAAIPAIHGLGGEDGELQKLLESLPLPYIFSRSAAHKIGIDKLASKRAAVESGLKTPALLNTRDMSFPVFAKPRFGGSSIAAKYCQNEEDLAGLKMANPNVEFVIEQPIQGREFTVGVVVNKGVTFALPVVEIIPKSKFFDFNSKYDPENLAQEICPAQIDERLSNQLKRQALAVHKKIGALHISRSDFICIGSEIYFLEINTIPGLTNTSLIPKMLTQDGLRLSDLLNTWCQSVAVWR